MIPYTMRNHALAAALTVGLLFSSFARAEDWPQWRGPHFNGSSESKGLPEKLDGSTQAWAATLPGGGSGTPVIFQDRIFVSCLDAASQKLLAVCISRKDGAVLWSKQVGEGFLKNNRNDTASPSAITDGKMAWFYFGTGDLVAYDLDGNVKWARNIQKDFGAFNIQWIYSSSPLLYRGKLYVQVLQRDVPPSGPPTGRLADSYLLAIDATTGKDLWRHIRPNDARAESKESYATPVPYENEGHAEVLLIGGDCVTAHDPENGNELWRCGGWNPQKIEHWRVVSSVVATDGLVFACPPKKGAIFAIKDGGSGDVTSTGVAWKNPEITTDAAVPLVYKGHLYVLDGDKKMFSCVEPKTGKVLWSGSLGGHAVFRGSPTGADDKIYCMNETGEVVILATDEFKILGKFELGGMHNHASIAVVDGEVIVRAGDKLIAFKG